MRFPQIRCLTSFGVVLLATWVTERSTVRADDAKPSPAEALSKALDEARYSGMPSRLYLIDSDGRVVYKSGRGPFGFKPAELEHSLVLLLRAGALSGSPEQIKSVAVRNASR